MNFDPGNCLINNGKSFKVENCDSVYHCFAIKTKLVTKNDSIVEIALAYAKPFLHPGDILFLSEKMVGCTQGRAIPIDKIKPRFWAKILFRFVTKSPYGIGLAMPETMQCAIDEAGLLRILLACAVGLIGKLFGKRGLFYHVAGTRVSSIDGPCENTIPPLNKCVSLAPLNPKATAKKVSDAIGGNLVLIVDLNDLGGRILGSSRNGIDNDMYLSLLSQNPLGQGCESTPMGILRPAAQ